MLLTVSGTATGQGTDHDLAEQTVTIPAGEQTAAIHFNVFPDGLIASRP